MSVKDVKKKDVKKKEVKPSREEIKAALDVILVEEPFDYYRVRFQLTRPQLGTGSSTSIYHKHVLEKNKKLIKQANRLKDRVTKVLSKYVGSDIKAEKELQELQGIARTYMQALGRQLEVPDTVEELLEMTKTLEEDWSEVLRAGDVLDPTIFMRNAEGQPIIGTHMILGNLKAQMKNLVNNGDKSMLSTKVSIGEVFSLDVKAVDSFMMPDHDILRADSQSEFNKLMSELPTMGTGRWIYEEGTGRVLLERPVLFDDKGTTKTAILLSEALPIGTEFEAILRVRSRSPIGETALNRLLTMGKSQGFGAWRGSGNAGAFVYKLDKLKDYKEDIPEGWN